MSEVKSLRFNDPDLEAWVDEHVEKGELNPLMNMLLKRYRQEQEQEYIEQEQEIKTERKIVLFQGIVFISIAIWMLVFAFSKFYDALSIIATYLLILSGTLLCVYVIIWRFSLRNGKYEVMA